MPDGAAIAIVPAWFFNVPKTFNPLSDDGWPHRQHRNLHPV